MSTDIAATTDLTEIDGLLVADDGEIVGLAFKDEFHVTDHASAAWVLEKMMVADAALVAVEARQQAILANLDTERRQQQRRREWFEHRFGAELAAFARANLKGKAKTWMCEYGKVSFRTTQPGIEVTDEAKAIAYVKSLGIALAVMATERLMLSECKVQLLADPPPDGHGLKVKAAGEKCDIKTGVK